MIGEVTKGGCLMGSQWSYHILMFFPLPTRNLEPILITSLPFKMLFQAYDPVVDSLASMNEQ